MIVIGCGKQKLGHAAPAGELYTGALFRLARRYAVASRQYWVILSALHGIIEPEVVLEPYDAELGGDVEGWAERTSAEIAKRRDRGERVELLAGVRYTGPLRHALGDFGIRATEPLRGLVLGHRLRKLREMAEEAESLHQRHALVPAAHPFTSEGSGDFGTAGKVKR